MDKKEFVAQIRQGLQTYEREFQEMRLHLVDEVLNLVSSLNRALSMSQHIFMSGQSGTGRRSCLLLAASMLRMPVVSPSLSRGYGVRDFRKELKMFMERTVAENKPLILLIEDHHLSHPEFLELLNSLISSNEIPGLFTLEEVEHIFPDPEQVRGETYGRTFFEAFCERVKRNLRVVISMNHKQESFLQNCAANPALFTKCTIIWSGAWADASMEMILKEELQDDISSLAAKERDNLIRCTIQIHELCQKRSARVQPLYFFSVARTYLQIYRLKLSARGSQATHLRKGLQKLREAKQLVGQLTLEAEEKQRLLAQQ